MPKQIDLEPHEYRRRGFRLPHPLDSRKWSLSGIACGLWAGSVIGLHRYWISGDNPWLVAAISLAPAVVWGVLLLWSDRPD